LGPLLLGRLTVLLENLYGLLRGRYLPHPVGAVPLVVEKLKERIIGIPSI
jgi:hypothetical protein